MCNTFSPLLYSEIKVKVTLRDAKKQPEAYLTNFDSRRIGSNCHHIRIAILATAQRSDH